MPFMQTTIQDEQMDPKSIQELMNESSLGAIVKKALILDKIDRVLPDLLNKEISDHIHVLNLKEQCLILASNNSAIATCLRYREEELLKKLHKVNGLPRIQRIECVVRP